ncbi:MAG: hypothetical protein LBD52_06985 [Prevotellaceae bacterium]|nr:hypothetical protein [Prevotellaceae bacterium]
MVHVLHGGIKRRAVKFWSIIAVFYSEGCTVVAVVPEVDFGQQPEECFEAVI